jgi:hypothetical protein
VRPARIVAACVAAIVLTAGVAEVARAQDTITATCSIAGQDPGQPCTSQWYVTPVTVSWELGSTLSQQPSGCQLAVYKTDESTTLYCAVTWSDGTSSTFSFPLHIEISIPSASATPDRPPDVNGWYNHPVTVTLSGSAFSGIASCTPPQTYGGAATTSTALGGTCTDNAGKVASVSFPFRYDATPPSLTVSAQPADRLAALSWRANAGPAPLAPVQITRRPGLRRAASSVVYTGTHTAYRDRRVRNGTTYTYTITAVDQAGNLTQRTIRIRPGIRLLAPQADARLSGPPTLRWTAVRKASYYNVQLFRGSKILSAWPRHASLRLARSWRFAGRRHRLAPGRYHWYVWPGYGPQSASRYGRAVGNAVFVIR